MAKLVGLKINKQFGCLEAQELDFNKPSDTLIEVKGNVGSGKTTLNKACLLTTAGKKALADENAYGKTFDVETEICMMDGKRVFCRSTRKDGGNITSTVYLKDKDGNKLKTFLVNDRKVTPGKFLEMLRTELTFNIDQFLSEHDITHFNFMSKLFGHKLKEVGIILNKKEEGYQGSVLDRLERAKAERTEKERNKKAVNGFKTALEDEGYSELNIPPFIDIDDLKAQIEGIRRSSQDAKIEAQSEFYKTQQQAQNVYNEKISAFKEKASEINAVFTAYNANIENQIALHQAECAKRSNNIELANDCARKLKTIGYASEDLAAFIAQMPAPETKEFKKIEFIDNKPKQHEGLPKECVEAFIKRSQLGREFKLIEKPANVEFEYHDDSHKKIDVLLQRISEAEKTNLIAKRWDAFKAHQAADRVVKKIQKEYRNKFAEIDFGVPGLVMSVDEYDSIKTYYNGEHNPEFFRNENKEMRLLNAYSLTQKNVIGVLMQVYLLEEKKKSGQDPLYNMWVDFPMDNNTRKLLIDVQKKYDISLITNTTGDFENAVLDGEYVIKNGILLSNGEQR